MTYDIHDLLAHLDPARLDYEGWISVGMALKDEGLSAADWDAWSQRDPARYHAGECDRKWKSFAGAANPVTVGTIVQLARDQGYNPPRADDYALDWDAEIGHDDDRIIDHNWIESRDVPPPPADEDWHPARQLSRYLELLFEASEIVGYVTESWWSKVKQKHEPSRGAYDRTAGALIEALSKCRDDIGAVLGDHRPEVGAWIRFNPLDGEGVKDQNVTKHRFALVESDSQDIDHQYAIIRELELPVAVLVHSGGKSLHAIVHIDAANKAEYSKRVAYLYGVCERNGLKIDRNSRNPSRLSRMPGAIRNGNKQYIVAEGMGKKSYNEWYEWVENSSYEAKEKPPRKTFDNVISARELHEKTLSPVKYVVVDMFPQGLSMLASPPKYGKSWFVLDLCLSVAAGRAFLNHKTVQCGCLYLALEDSQNRLKDRMEKLLGFENPPELFDFALSALDVSNGLLDQLEDYMNSHPQTGLIVIDTLQKVRAPSNGKESAYGADYREIGALKSFADNHEICLLLVHHLRKASDDTDPFNRISGTNGILSAVDTALVMAKKSRGDSQTILHLVGRDVESADTVIEFDKGEWRWKVIGDSASIQERIARMNYQRSAIVQTIKALLEQNPGGWRGSMKDLQTAGMELVGEYISSSARKLSVEVTELDRLLFEYDGIVHSRAKNGNGGGAHHFRYAGTGTNGSEQEVDDAEQVSLNIK